MTKVTKSQKEATAKFFEKLSKAYSEYGKEEEAAKAKAMAETWEKK